MSSPLTFFSSRRIHGAGLHAADRGRLGGRGRPRGPLGAGVVHAGRVAAATIRHARPTGRRL